jgi:hypothetical protein
MSLVFNSFLSSVPVIHRLGLLIEFQSSCMFHLYFFIMFSLSSSDFLNYIDCVFKSWYSAFQLIQSARETFNWIFLFDLRSFSFPELQFDFFRICMPLLNFSFMSYIVFFHFSSLSLFNCLFVFSLILLKCLYISSFILLIVLLNSKFGISCPSLLFRSFVVWLLTF